MKKRTSSKKLVRRITIRCVMSSILICNMILAGCDRRKPDIQSSEATEAETESREEIPASDSIFSMPAEYTSLFDYDGYSPIIKDGAQVTLSRRAGDGKPENVSYITSYPSDFDMPLRQFDTGPEIAELSKGKVNGGVNVGKFQWDDRAYSSVYVEAEDAQLPGLRGNGGILFLNIKGNCNVETDNIENSAIQGFDSVVICGDGTLTIAGGEGIIDTGGGKLPMPSMIIEGAVLRCRSINIKPNKKENSDYPAYLQLSGQVQTDNLCLNWGTYEAGFCLNDGVLCTRTLDAKITGDLVFRGGVGMMERFLLNNADATVLVSGAKIYSEKLEIAGASVIAGKGILSAPEISYYGNLTTYEAEVIDTDQEEDRFCQLYFPEELYGKDSWIKADDTSGITFCYNTPETIGTKLVCSTLLKLDHVTMSQLTPWGGLAIELMGDNKVETVDPQAGAYTSGAVVFTGDGTLTLKGNHGFAVYGMGMTFAPYAEIRDKASIIVDAESDVFTMSSEKGEEGEFLLSGGSFSAEGDGWCQNCTMTINDGSFELTGTLCFDKGKLIINGGDVTLGAVYMQDGDIIINGGTVEITEDTMALEKGSITINGGTIRIKNGRDSLYTGDGEVTVNADINANRM